MSPTPRPTLRGLPAAASRLQRAFPGMHHGMAGVAPVHHLGWKQTDGYWSPWLPGGAVPISPLWWGYFQRGSDGSANATMLADGSPDAHHPDFWDNEAAVIIASGGPGDGNPGDGPVQSWLSDIGVLDAQSDFNAGFDSVVVIPSAPVEITETYVVQMDFTAAWADRNVGDEPVLANDGSYIPPGWPPDAVLAVGPGGDVIQWDGVGSPGLPADWHIDTAGGQSQHQIVAVKAWESDPGDPGGALHDLGGWETDLGTILHDSTTDFDSFDLDLTGLTLGGFGLTFTAGQWWGDSIAALYPGGSSPVSNSTFFQVWSYYELTLPNFRYWIDGGPRVYR